MFDRKQVDFTDFHDAHSSLESTFNAGANPTAVRAASQHSRCSTVVAV